MKPLLLVLVLCVSISAQNLTADRVDFPNLPATGAQKIVKAGGYGVTYFSYDFGIPQHDDVLCVGYNCGGPEHDSSKVQWHQAFENYYTTSQGITQSEFYITACQPDGGICSRPFAIDFYHDTGGTMVGAWTQTFAIGSPVDNNPWIRFQSTPTTGIVSLVRNSKIDFSGNTREWFIVRANAGILGQSGTTGKLFTGGLGGETLNIFEGGFVNAQFPMTINVGNSSGGSFRIGSDGKRWQATGNHAGFSSILTEADKPAPCSPIADASAKGGIDTVRAINELLQCLRQQGLLLP